MTLEEHIGQLVRDAVEPMLVDMEERLVTRLETLEKPGAPEVPPELLILKELAAYLRISVRTAQRMLSKGELPEPMRVTPGRPLWRRQDIDAWLARRDG